VQSIVTGVWLAEMITEQVVLLFSFSITTPCMQHLTFTYVRSILSPGSFRLYRLLPGCSDAQMLRVAVHRTWQLAHPFFTSSLLTDACCP
jgi:hypothetical protein